MKIQIPVIENAASKMATIERRLVHLKERLARAGYEQSPSASFDRAEVSALESAMVALKFVVSVRNQ